MIKAYDDYTTLPDDVKGGVVVIGNFDGLHRGHQALIKTARDLAVSGQPVVALTFDPHPRQIFRPDAPPFRLSNRDLKIEALSKNGVNHVVIIPFNREFSMLSAKDFITRVLVDGLSARHIVVGDDFVFGHNRGGTIDTLTSDDRFDVTPVKQITTDSGEIFGSSTIRRALKRGDMDTARHQLGHAWHMTGIVIHGDKRGRELGYPTANILMGDFIHPAYGIYAVRAQTPDGIWHDGVANIGIRPMFETKQPLLEVHIFDFDGDLYDQQLRVEFVAYLRAEMKFDTLDHLINQMNRDSEAAKAILKN